jgi:hypothetical protein
MNQPLHKTLLFGLAAILFTAPVRAQQSTSLPPTPAPQNPDDKSTQSQRELQQEEQQRMAGIIPAFRVVLNGTAAPINPRQKFELFVKDAFDPFSFAVAVADSAWEQYRDDYPTWGTQPDGYGKRFAASFGDELDGNLWGKAILPSVLHQDPRYFRLGHGGFPKRLGYSIASIARCKGDNGKWQPNYSLVSGDLIAGAVSNAYYPASERGIGLTFQRGFTVVGVGAVSSIADEFYPDIVAAFNHMFKRKEAEHDLPPSLWPPH